MTQTLEKVEQQLGPGTAETAARSRTPRHQHRTDQTLKLVRADRKQRRINKTPRTSQAPGMFLIALNPQTIPNPISAAPGHPRPPLCTSHSSVVSKRGPPGAAGPLRLARAGRYGAGRQVGRVRRQGWPRDGGTDVLQEAGLKDSRRRLCFPYAFLFTAIV